MSRIHRGWAQALVLRASGTALLAGGYIVLRWLFHSARVGGNHDSAPLDYLAAAAGFLCLSAGATLTVLGGHIFDPVELSARWIVRRN